MRADVWLLLQDDEIEAGASNEELSGRREPEDARPHDDRIALLRRHLGAWGHDRGQLRQLAKRSAFAPASSPSTGWSEMSGE